MDQNLRVIDDFEDLLKKRSLKQPPALYSSSEHKKESINTVRTGKLCSAKELLANVARQVKAIQNADTSSYKSVGSRLDKYKKREFVTMDMIPIHSEVPQNINNKFDTQCVTDSQLMNVIENAEIIDRHRGITQAFDETFCQKSDEDDSDVKLNDVSLKSVEKIDVIDKIKDSNVDIKECDLNDKEFEPFENSHLVTCEMDTITYCQSDIVTDNDDEINDNISQDIVTDNDDEINDNIGQNVEQSNICIEIDESESASPILITNRKEMSPLVVSLYTFENFENLALPIIEKHEDNEIAKHLINSQIVGREICIPDHFYEGFARESPVFHKIDSITTNINQDELKSECTCSNIYTDDDVNDDSVKEVRARASETNIMNENKKTAPSVKLTDIKDEILFSSDEEYDYLHRDVQELPLTCALETSFYETSDVLDKTMYVGFQTASNKSIQIQTDSFYRAKSILSIDKEGTETTLTDLVQIFDSGKAVNENIQTIQSDDSMNATQNSSTNNKTSSEDKHKEDTNLPSTSENSIEREREIDDTFQSVCLTELEQDGNLNGDDIVMSQIIKCKSISRTTKSSNIKTPKIVDTLDNVTLTKLEPDKQMDDDVPMSQVIECKSIARTPRYAENVSSTAVNDVLARPSEVTKRKFEGFKTASNKRIKLSDKAMARCKKVFQDIELNDTEDIHCKSTNKTANDVLDEDLGFRVLGVSRHAIKTTSDVSHSTKDLKNDIGHNKSKLSEVADAEIDDDSNVRHNTTNFDAQDRTSKIEDADLQINDQILREFEDNVMPFEETNNNAYIGFKTANNKNIVISNIAMMKSKHLFQDIMTSSEENDCDSITKTAQSDDIEKCQIIFKKPTANHKKVIDKQITLSNKALSEVNILPQAEKGNKHDIHQPSSSFKTPANKEIDASDQTKEEGKDTSKCFDKEFMKNVDDGENIHTAVEEFNCGIDTQDFFGEDLTRIEEFFKENETENKKLDTAIFKGFQTASKKVIVISEKAMEKSKKLFEDISDKESDSKLNVNDVKGTQENENKERIDSQQSKSTYVGFDNTSIETKLKDLVNTSKDSYIEKREKNIDVPDCRDINMEAPKFLGFQTASAKPIHISAAAIERTKKLLNEFELDNDISVDYEQVLNPMPSTSAFVGFQTASNKQIKVSAKPLAKSKELLSDFELKIDSDKTNSVTPFNNVNNNPCVPSTSKVVGFQTASKKEVKISNDALAKSKKLFQDIDIVEKKSETVSEEVEEGQKSNQLKGVQTANNKIVSISEEALEKSRDLFHGNDHDQKKQESAPVFQGFQMASNKKVHISKDALARSRKILQDVDIFENETDVISNEIEKESNVFKGFQTASNKKVIVSEKALDKSKKLLNDIATDDLSLNDKNADVPAFRGFQTANHKAVKISEEALATSKKIFQDIDIFGKESETISNKVEQDEMETPFKGFQTPSNKEINISEKALEKSRQLFDGIDYNGLKDEKDKFAPVFQGFQTASNKKVKISDNALAKSKKVLEDLNLSQLDRNPKTTVDTKTRDEKIFQDMQTINKENIKDNEQTLVKTKDEKKDANRRSENNLNINTIDFKVDDQHIDKDVIDTQVMNDFQETLNTEDFCRSTPKSKRSGSPILSCPKAKKRKFEAPHRTNKKVESKNIFVPPKLAKTYNFDDAYKKQKKYTLKDIENLEKELNKNKTAIDPYISKFNFDTLLNFKFSDSRNDYTKGKINVEDLKKIFLGSVNKKIVPEGWLDNHVKLIIWKLLSYEIKYPNVMKTACTVRNVLEQLKYRYDRELYHVERPILRKVLEKDEVPSRTMVLCVAGIYVDSVSVASVNTSQNVELLLTDGWYCVKACTDRMLVRLLAKGAIVVGTKIAVCGAELVNCDQGIAPWEDTSSVRLKLSGNSARPCPWHTRLGLRPGLVQCPLGAVRADGGRVAALRVMVTRVYPPLYVEKMEDGSTVTLSERLEHTRQMKHESEREAIMEKLYEEVEKEMSDQDSQDSEGFSNGGLMDSGSQISRCMKKTADPDEYRANLTKSQNRMLEEYNSRQREKLIERVREKFQQKLENNGLRTDRNVIPLLKVRVAGFSGKNGVEIMKGYLSIWRPSAAVLELVTEDAWIEVLNVIPTGIRNSEVQLSAGRQTVFNPYKQTKNDRFNLYAKTLRRKCYEIKEITQNPAMTTDYNEIDTVGMIFCIEPSTKEFDEKQSFQNIYLADAEKNIVCVNFWGGLKKIGFENVLDTGQIVTCVNLQKRAGNTRKSIPQYRATEFSYFTKTPKDKKALELTNELSNKLLKVKDKFCHDCMLLRSNYSIFKTRDNENCSPYRFECNVSKNMMSPISTLRKCEVNLNLTGLDFESSFDSQEISPQALLRKKKINEKIEKIRLNYGEPPPLASIHIINQSKNASATYKSPLISNSERSKNVVSAETPGLQNVASPVSMNRTYVKNVNPVKLDFSRANLNDSVDHFAEDFEASPPLSLDSDVVNN